LVEVAPVGGFRRKMLGTGERNDDGRVKQDRLDLISARLWLTASSSSGKVAA